MSRLKTILALGDSLTEGFGVPADAAFPCVLQQLLRQRGHIVSIINHGLSGDTVGGGKKRLERYLTTRPRPDAVIVALGANDAFQRNDPWDVEASLDGILQRLTEEDIPCLFAGMQVLDAVPSSEDGYASAFSAIYPKLAERYEPVFCPFFLEGVAGNAALHQADGIHPNREGTALVARHMLPYAETLLNLSR